MDNLSCEEFLMVFRTNYSSILPYKEDVEDLISRYEGKIITKGEEDNLAALWRSQGLAGYRDGLFWTIDPDEYAPLLQPFSSFREEDIPFARSACGNFFLFSPTDEAIVHMDVHRNKRSIVSTSIEVFFPWDLAADNYWNRMCSGGIELEAVKRYGSPGPESCYSFTPALSLGGDECVENMNCVDLKANLVLLAQCQS